MTETAHPLSYRFSRFELQPSERRLLSSGQPAALNPRAFDLLVALIERAGQLVTKDELLQRVWPKLVVEEANLHMQISTLRKVLGAAAIETVPGHGYRLTLEIGASLAGPPATPPVRKHNLPRPLTSFVGREDDLAELLRLLDRTRLLTITGVGGLGKTRLSLHLAAAVLERFPDGVWLVELAPLSDPRLVDAAVAAALGVSASAGGSVRDAVINNVRDRNLLLLLDNCEHVLAAAAELVTQLMQSGPQLKLVATSREPLRVAGEVTYPLSPLSLPGAGEKLSPDALLRQAAARLFIDRAAAAQPGFHATPQNMAAIAEICRRLDGIPLALELAAARTRALSVETIASRLGDRFHLLTGGNQTALPRQQTLRATIDWSYDLLAPREHGLFSRLAVFAGGFTVDAAEAVGTGGIIAREDVLDLLSNLVEKSLVVAEPDRERYRMLETVRQYAFERLAESGDDRRARSAHLEHFLTLAEFLEPKLLGPEQGTWHARLDRERENILAAHSSCDAAERGAQSGLRLVAALRQFWICRGPLQLGYRVTVEALARTEAHARNFPRCRALFTAGVLAYYMGALDDARRHGDEGLSIAREIGDKSKTSDALALLGAVALAQAQLPAARAHLMEAMTLGRTMGDNVRLAQALVGLAEIHAADADLSAAESLFEEGLVLWRELGERESTAGTLINLARTSIGRGSPDRATQRLLEAADIIAETGSQHQMQQWLAIAGGLATSRGDWNRAAWLFGAASARRKQASFRLEPVDYAFLAPLVARSREALGEIAFSGAEAAGAATSDDGALAEAIMWLRRGDDST